MTTIYFTDKLCWKKENAFLTATETEFLGRLENKLTTFEVLKHNDFEYKLYFDIDCDTIAKEYFNNDLCNIVEEEGEAFIRECLETLTDIEPNISIATSHTDNYKNNKTKISVRYFVSNIRANKKLQLKFVKQMNKFITSKKNEKLFIFKHIPFTEKLFDEGIYDLNRKMRCLNSSKPNENRPLVILRGEPKNTIISGFFDENPVILPDFTVEEVFEENNTDSESILSDITLTEEEENYNDIDYLLNVCIQNKMCNEGDHTEWNIIGQALKNELGPNATEPFLKWTLKYGSSNKKDEAFNQITKYIKKAPKTQKDRLTFKTIHFYAKKYNINAYNLRFNKICTIPIEYADIEENIFDCSEYDLANYFCKKWGYKFKCVDIDKKIFYGFNENRLWEYFKTGQLIREIISNEMCNDFKKYQQYCLEEMQKYDQNEEAYEKIGKKIKKIAEICINLGRTNTKNNITREIQDKIFDSNFENLLNKKKYFLPIKNNKMFNMKTLEVTDRTINDLFSYECNANYVTMTDIEEKEIKQYFLDLFCGKEDTMQVVINILKSMLTGEPLRYIFFFTGSGCNGKSLLFNILGKIFNKAIDTIDTRVILESKSSNLTTEFEKLDKCRLAYVTELKETDTLNISNIKKITGGDPIDFRGLYQSNKTMVPTCSLGVVLNPTPIFPVEKAMMDRTVVVPFNNTFEVDNTFESKMLEKKDLIFSFIMKNGIIQDKFNLTEEMLYAKDCYKNDNMKIDYMQEFINKTYKIVPFVKKEKIQRDSFRTSYNEFLKSKGQSFDTSSHQKFSRLIQEKGIGIKESNGKTFYTGLVVNMDDDLLLDENEN